VLHPMLMTLVISIVFTTLFFNSAPNFPLYYLSGLLLFQFNSDATSVALNTISKNSAIIGKVYVPRYMFCISDLSVSFVNTIFTFIPLTIVAIVLKAPFTWLWLLIPVVLLLQVMFTLGLSLVLAAYGVFLKDLHHLYSIFIMMWMFLTPLFYPISIVDPKYLFIWQMNPMVHYVTIFRSIVYLGVMPELTNVIIGSAYSVLMLALGCAVFKENQDKFFLYI
jgi:ABC-type polysaccharide/polyol phosphate export permease